MLHPMLGNDLVINEDSCNLACNYCLTGQSNLKAGHRAKLIFQPGKRDDYSPGTSLQQRLDVITDRVKNTFDTPFLKITGGEIFMVKGVMDLFERAVGDYEVVVVQTNGVLVKPEHLERFKAWGNVVLQISLDSHLYHGNRYRVPNEDLHGRIVKRIRGILESGLPCEIYAVLNDRSVAEMEPFAEWMMDIVPHPVYFPFPVRGPDSEEFQLRPEQVRHVERFVERYDEFAPILPPRPYFDRLMRLLREGERRFRCHLPRLVMSTFSDGMLTACPNIWFSDMGNVLADDWDGTAEKVGETGMYQALLAPRPRLDACKKCYTPWDLLSMYFDDEITLDELCQSPTYAPEPVRSLIAGQKEKYLEAARAAGTAGR